jgi:hypothetical protein
MKFIKSFLSSATRFKKSEKSKISKTEFEMVIKANSYAFRTF